MKVLFCCLILAIALMLSGCALPASSETGQIDDTPLKTTASSSLNFNNDNWHLAIAEAKGAQSNYIHSDVILTGEISQIVAVKEKETQFTITTDFEDSNLGDRTLIVIDQPLSLNENQWVRITGILSQYWSTTNLMGGVIRVPVIDATSVEVISRSEAITAKYTINLNNKITQYGLSVEVQKIELASTETRIYVNIENNSQDKAVAYDFDAVIVEAGKQYKTKYVFSDDIKEIDDSLLPGTDTQGVIIFEPLNLDIKQASFIWDGPHTDDYSLNFVDWVWEFSW
jgi:hypothetical protein